MYYRSVFWKSYSRTDWMAGPMVNDKWYSEVDICEGTGIAWRADGGGENARQRNIGAKFFRHFLNHKSTPLSTRVRSLTGCPTQVAKLAHVRRGVDLCGRNWVRRARRRGGNRAVSRLQKRGFHALPAPEIYTSEYMSQLTSNNLATLKGFPLIKTLFIKWNTLIPSSTPD